MAVYSPITAARFWSKVDVKWSAKDCWNWRGATRKGYGNIKIEGQSHSSNRVALELFTGEPLGELMALHTCDNKLCCNPRHLYAGDASDNMTDIHDRQGHCNDTLRPDDVLAIKARLKMGHKHREIAEDYGVNKCHISKIKAGKAWARITEAR